MLQNAVNSKIAKIVYRLLLPIAAILLLLLVASFNKRPYLLGAAIPDFIIRFLLTIWFCGIYIQISRIDSFSYYPNIKWTKKDIGPIEKYYLWSMVSLFCIAFGVITWWVIHWFFAIPPYLASLLSVVHSFIIFLPSITHYWVFKV